MFFDMPIALFVVNSTLLFICTFVLAVLAARRIDFKKTLRFLTEQLSEKYNDRRLVREFARYKRSIPIKMSLIEKIELNFIDKSNIRHYVPFMNFYTLAALCMLIFAALFKPVFDMLLFVPSAGVICFLFSLTPVFVLDLMGRYNAERIRRKLAEFISVLNRWCAVKEDIFYAFEKAVESEIGMPLKTFVRDMVIQVHRGIDPLEALDMLMMKVDNMQFRDFVINIKHSIKYRGNIRKLLDNMESQFYKIEEEYNRRRISTYRDRLVTYCVMFVVLCAGYFFLASNPTVKEFYFGTLQGKLLLTLFCMLYSCGFALSFKVMKFNY